MLFIQYPPCSTCQKAKKWLDAQNVIYTDRHIKLQNPTYEELKAQIQAEAVSEKTGKLVATGASVFMNVDIVKERQE